MAVGVDPRPPGAAGDLREVIRVLREPGGAVSSNWIEHPIKTAADLEALAAIHEDELIELDRAGVDRTRERAELIGSDGIVLGTMPGTPLGMMYRVYSGVAALAYLFFVLGLSLSGMINLGAGIMGVGNSLAAKSGYAGSFFTGVLATVVASPCSAPFMGSALGFAMTQPAVTALTIFAALGFGMAAPFLLLTLSPATLRRLPKPGAWMEGFKQLLAFPLYGAVVWLLWVLGKQSGVNGMAAVAGGCVLLALGLWIRERASRHKHSLLLRALAVAVLLLALLVLRSPLLAAKPAVEGPDASANWENYDPARLAQLRAQGKAVFVNVTADWCITCLANEKLALSSAIVTDAVSYTHLTLPTIYSV